MMKFKNLHRPRNKTDKENETLEQLPKKGSVSVFITLHHLMMIMIYLMKMHIPPYKMNSLIKNLRGEFLKNF